MKVAIEGCCHGQLPAIYAEIQSLEIANNYKVDLLLICGDFQAIRNQRDLQCMAVPDKYKQLGEFHEYYTGQKKAPILTIVIGGNHEASNYLWELFHGGWLAPNIYFLGVAGSVLVNGIRISGASGIFKAYNFTKGYFERQPYSKDDLRSIYHIRESAIRQLSLLPPSVNASDSTSVFLSHDWPLNITSYAPPAALNDLLRKKPYFKQEVTQGILGSPPLMGLLNVLKPRWWFSAHLHVGFEARIWWGSPVPVSEPPFENAPNPEEIVIDEELAVTTEETSCAPLAKNPDEILFDDLDEDVEASPPPLPLKSIGRAGEWFTQFIALDKCLPKRKFLEIIDIDTPNSVNNNKRSASELPDLESPPRLTFDPYWLAITRAFHSQISLAKHQQPFPSEEVARKMVEENLKWVRQNVPEEGQVRVTDIQQFVLTTSGPNSETAGKEKLKQPPAYSNPQTEAFCRMLSVYNFVNPEGVNVQ
ncbi:hypothetical protein D9757_002084 [Collybiopsis confluens]|uniref:Lariat debranching enzyme C-terminal domain-containing protein n=1 Tax=Collybiopsis confluens TaxID=2823264 RepID=A0A8H5HXE5_9AGAR|nr:hypothetical protein D9757_002084 [Collybiopsis confluens]